MRPTTTSIKKWWYAKSDLFTTMCATEPGETFTNGEVVIAHIVLVAFLIIAGIAGAMEGGMQ